MREESDGQRASGTEEGVSARHRRKIGRLWTGVNLWVHASATKSAVAEGAPSGFSMIITIGGAHRSTEREGRSIALLFLVRHNKAGRWGRRQRGDGELESREGKEEGRLVSLIGSRPQKHSACPYFIDPDSRQGL